MEKYAASLAELPDILISRIDNCPLLLIEM